MSLFRTTAEEDVLITGAAPLGLSDRDLSDLLNIAVFTIQARRRERQGPPRAVIPAPRALQHWTNQERERVFDLHEEGATIAKIADTLGRSRGSIEAVLRAGDY